MSGIMQLLLASRPQAVPDPYFEYTTLLLPGNGTNGAQNNTFLDSSTNAFSITRNGNTTQGTFSPFSQTGWGNYFNGPSTGSYLRTPANTDFQLGTSDFTIEFWAYTTDITSDTTVCQTDSGGSGFFGMLLNYCNGTNITWYATSNGSSWNVINGGVLCSAASIRNTWAHFAYVRNGSTFTAYVNGTAAYTTTSAASIYQSANQFVFGSSFAGSHPSNFGGYLSNFRYVKGTAVYTSNFTPSTTPLTAITNTKLLSCQANRFIDSSASAHTLTVGGSPTVQAFSPFNPTAAWSAATNGGSGYFDGSGDFLSVASNAAFGFDAGDFTVETFIYINSYPAAYYGLIDTRISGATGIGTYVDSAGTLLYASNAIVLASGGTVGLRQWVHIAVTRSSGTVKGFINGVQVFSITDSRTLASSAGLYLANDGVSGTLYTLNGYMSNARVVKGTAVYTTTFTPPTAPVSAISGTSLLANFTNAGIYDATSKNDLETVGNAQISTTQSKFGGSSMYFDGTDDRLLVPTSPNLTFGTGDFTIEAWVNRSTSGSVIHFIDFRGSNNDGSNPVFYWQTNNFIYYTNNNTSGDNQIQTSNAITSSSGWVHLAIVRFGTTLTVYVNGVASGSTTYSTNVLGGNPVTIANRFNNSGAYTGYINDLRITKGYARYTTNFTPPTAAFPVQ